MQKALDQMNVQIHRAVTDLTGTTGLAIVRAIVAGERDPTRLATLRDPRCRKSETAIAEHLTGTWRDEHLFNLASALQLFDALTQMIASYETRLLEELAALAPPDRHDDPAPPHPNPTKRKAITGRGDEEARTILWRFSGVDLTRIDGLSVGGAQVILAEVGPDLAAFPSEKDFISWLRLCPRTPISGGKPLKKRRNALGANRVAAVLRMGAVSQRSKTALGAAFRRLAARTARWLSLPWRARWPSSSTACCATGRTMSTSARRPTNSNSRFDGSPDCTTPPRPSATRSPQCRLPRRRPRGKFQVSLMPPQPAAGARAKARTRSVRPRPVAKRVWASVEREPLDVVAEATLEAEHRDPEHVKHWVALVDGAETQLVLVEEAAAARGVDVTVILDIIHVVEYVWKAAHAFHPAGSLELACWAWTRVRRILEGRARTVAASMRGAATVAGLSPDARKPVDTSADYLRKYAPYLH